MSTALAVVESMQQKVGSSLVATSGSVLQERSSDSALQVLEQLRDLQLKTVRGISRVYDMLAKMLNFENAQAARLRDQKNELDSEGSGLMLPGMNMPEIGDGGQEASGGSSGGMLAAAAGGAGLGIGGLLLALRKRITTLFAPLIRFFGKTGPFGKIFTRLFTLMPFLSRFGPIGLVITGIQLLMHYMDDIVAALAPVLDIIKKMWVSVKPLFDAILLVGDLIIKSGIALIGTGLEIAFGLISSTLDTLLASVVFVKDLIIGLVTGDMELIKGAWGVIKTKFAKIGSDIIGVFTGAFTGLITKIEEIFNIEDLVGTVTTAFTNMVAWFTKIGKAIYNPETGALFGYTWDMVKGTITDSFDSMGTWFVNLGKKIYNSETGELFGYQLPTLPTLDSIGTWFTDLGKKVYNPETGELFGYQLPAMPSLSDIGTWFTTLGNKIYNSETNSLFGYTLPVLPSLGTMFDKIKELRNKIYNPETGEIFGFTLPSFTDFELPNIGDMMKNIFASLLPAPGDWLYKFLPQGLKDIATEASITAPAAIIETMPKPKADTGSLTTETTDSAPIVIQKQNGFSQSTQNNNAYLSQSLDSGTKLKRWGKRGG